MLTGDLEDEDDEEHENGCTEDENDDRVDVIDVPRDGHQSQEELEINWQLCRAEVRWHVAVVGDESLVTSCLEAIELQSASELQLLASGSHWSSGCWYRPSTEEVAMVHVERSLSGVASNLAILSRMSIKA